MVTSLYKMAAEYCGVKCGLKFDPPTLFIFYKQTNASKLRKRSMPLRQLKSHNSTSEYAEELCSHERHGKFIQLIPSEQLVLLLERAKMGRKSEAPHFALTMPTTENNSDLPLTDQTKGVTNLQPKKSDLLGLGNLPSLEKTSLVSQGNTQDKAKKDLKSLGDRQKPKVTMDDDRSLEELLDDISGVSDEHVNPDREARPSVVERNGEDAYPLESSLQPTQGDDLNKVAEHVLTKRKEEMDVLFEAHRVKPGDEEWVYDKEVNFDEEDKVSCGWDSSERSDPEF